jgi:insertion element IS1 protein InsB
MKCIYCNGGCIKAGRQANGTQKYHCKVCGKYQQAEYLRKAWLPGTDAAIISPVKEGCGIWNTARLMKIAKGTVAARIKAIAARMAPPKTANQGLDYEVDELHTFIVSKQTECFWGSRAALLPRIL